MENLIPSDNSIPVYSYGILGLFPFYHTDYSYQNGNQ
jgi:hypothetical protein